MSGAGVFGVRASALLVASEVTVGVSRFRVRAPGLWAVRIGSRSKFLLLAIRLSDGFDACSYTIFSCALHSTGHMPYAKGNYPSVWVRVMNWGLTQASTCKDQSP